LSGAPTGVRRSGGKAGKPLDSSAGPSVGESVVLRCQSGSNAPQPTLEGAKFVVGKQHRPTTFPGTVRTPKKAADACLFCFTQWVPRSRLQSRYGIWLQSVIARLWGLRNGTV
jgi:hypothetical protein